MKSKTTYYCQNCGTQYAKWMGQCQSCGEWNTIAEELIQKETKRSWQTDDSVKKIANKPLKVSEITLDAENRISSTDSELDHVLGGGIVAGSIILIGGEPGNLL